MRFMSMYLVGFLIFMAGVVAALWKAGILASIGTTWSVIGLGIIIGAGLMLAVANSGEKRTIEIDRR